MIVRKSTCGLCKPAKKWKRNNTKLKALFDKEAFSEEMSANWVKSYAKKFKSE